MNRFKKRNDFHIARITTKDEADKVLDILEKQTDFRQMAVNQVTPFASDPNKKSFLVEKLNFPESNHFAVLWADGHPVAFNYGECDSDSVLLGVTSYDPLEGKNSPGIIFIMKLAELLKEEGFRYFDLSPGGNDYKQTFCNLTQKIYTADIFFNQKDKIVFDLKWALKESVKNSMIRLGYKPKVLSDKLNDSLSFLRRMIRVPPVEIANKLVAKLYKKETYVNYKFLTDDGLIDPFVKDKVVNVNNYTDLLLYDDSDKIRGKTDLLYGALRCFNSEDVLYTMVQNGDLVQYGWVSKGPYNRLYPEANVQLDCPESGMILHDLFISPAYSDQRLFEKMLKSMLIDCKANGAEAVFVRVREDDLATKSILEKIGFKLEI